MTEQGKKSALLSLLFGQDNSLVNIKFFRGEKDVVSEEEFCEQVHSALMQRHIGTAVVSDSFPEEARKRSAREFVSHI